MGCMDNFDDPVRGRPAGVVLEGVVRSTAYGLATPSSDEDRLGVYVAPTLVVLGLRWSQGSGSVVRHSPDAAWHELGKFVRLALAANPTIMELLWLEHWTVRTEVGERLVGLRRAFLSRRRVRDAYGGYARSQVDRLLRRGDGSFSSDTRGRTAKHGRHCMRLLLQGRALLGTGEMAVRLDTRQREWIFEMGELAVADGRAFAERFSAEDRRLQEAYECSLLPERPDVDAVEAMVVEARLALLDFPAGWPGR